MIVRVRVLGRELLAIETGTPDPDNGTDPGDTTSSPLPIGFHGVWEQPSIPALELGP